MMGYAGCKTKTALKAQIGQAPNFIETSIFGPEFKGDGTYYVVGPSPWDRRWYAEVLVSGGVIAKVK